LPTNWEKTSLAMARHWGSGPSKQVLQLAKMEESKYGCLVWATKAFATWFLDVHKLGGFKRKPFLSGGRVNYDISDEERAIMRRVGGFTDDECNPLEPFIPSTQPTLKPSSILFYGVKFKFTPAAKRFFDIMAIGYGAHLQHVKALYPDKPVTVRGVFDDDYKTSAGK
jgi:hypothetical protein